MEKKYRYIICAVLFCATFAFWMWMYPGGLNYQEQNQMFLWTGSYLLERLSVAGGFADWLSEFLVQFFRMPWAGAAIMALLALSLQAGTLHASGRKDGLFFFASLIPPVLWTVICGDMEILPTLAIALSISLFLCRPFAAAGLHKIWAAPLLWWLIGPVAFIPVLYSLVIHRNLKELALTLWAVAAAYILYRLFLMQYTPRDAAFGINYCRIVEILPWGQVVLPLVSLACALLIKWGKPLQHSTLLDATLSAVIIAAGWFGTKATYNADEWELLSYSMLERNEDFAGIIRKAEKYQPKNDVSATYVNYALAMEGCLKDRMWEFYQNGTRGLIMPSVRDNMSDIASCDILWMIGMTNISLQYAFDLQESIQNGRKSARFTSRIAECHIVNGHYEIARRYLDKLSHTIFYRKWALERLAMIDAGDEGVDTDPVYKYLRRAGFKTDFISNYEALDVMMAILYKQNDSNLAAAIYYGAWQELKKADKQRDDEEVFTGAHGS